MFERFTRGERAGGGGTGLGLAIARWVVQMHSGTIRVVDRPAGCLVRVSLPAGAAAHPESKAMAA
jgi:signal transduction histidine kinase